MGNLFNKGNKRLIREIESPSKLSSWQEHDSIYLQLLYVSKTVKVRSYAQTSKAQNFGTQFSETSSYSFCEPEIFWKQIRYVGELKM